MMRHISGGQSKDGMIRYIKKALKSFQQRASKSFQSIGSLIFRRLFPLFKPIGIIASFQNIAVMRKTIQQRGGHLGAAEDLDSFPKIEVGGDNQRGFLIQMADQVKQQGSAGCRKQQVTEFIKDNGIHDGELLDQNAGFALLFFPCPAD